MKLVLIPWPQMPPDADGGREIDVDEDCYLRLVDRARTLIGGENRPMAVWDHRQKDGRFWVAFGPRVVGEERREVYRPCRRRQS